MPRVSVIVPNYNHVLFLKKRLDSIVGQAYTDYELILLDDDSTDGSAELLKDFAQGRSNVRLVLNKENSGSPFIQWEKGCHLAKGDFIWIAESDDYCEPELLEQLVRPMVEDAAIGISYCRSMDVRGGTMQDRLAYTADFVPNIWERDFTMEGDEFVRSYLSVKNVIPNASAVVFRRSLLPHVHFGPMRTMRMVGDWLFWLQLCRHTRIHYTAKAMNYFRFHEGSSRRHHTEERARRRLREEFVIRQYMRDNYGEVDQQVQMKELVTRWMGRFSIREVLRLDPFRIPGFPGGWKWYALYYKALHLLRHIKTRVRAVG